MASLGREGQGCWRVLFVAPCGKRKTLRLGRTNKRAAEAVKAKVEHLLAAATSGCALDDETARWVAGLGDKLAGRLSAVGLVEPRASAQGLGPFVDGYISSRGTLKPNTLRNYRATRKALTDYFGEDKPLRAITAADCDKWFWQLAERGYAKATVGRHVKRAKQYMRAAVKGKLLAESPCEALKAPPQSNEARECFIARETIEAVLSEASGTEWRLLIALSRYGGLRCPSEHLALRWDGVDFAAGRMTVHSPKTEHHPGGASRVVPIFPELRGYLEDAWELAEDGAVYVIAKHRQRNANLRTQLQRFIERAGVAPWPKIFHNLRASRQTELTEEYPLHVVCKWLGNSPAVAQKHYLQVTDEHFERASGTPKAESGTPKTKGGTVAARKTAQYPAA